MCRVLAVSTSGYYAWRRRAPSRRQQENQALLERIRHLHQQSRHSYGSPRITHCLRLGGERCGRHRVARLMRADRLVAVHRRRYRALTDSDHGLPIARNLLDQDFSACRINQKWVADLTQVRTEQGWLYLAAVMDLYSRRIIGWAMSDRMKRDVVLEAQRMALLLRGPVEGLLQHTDRGSQYASIEYQALLRVHGVDASMSGVGNCYDNAAMESFFHTLKVELIHQRRYRTREEARQEIFEYIEVFYNRERLHSALGYSSPVDFELRASSSAPVCPP
jgi:transposase InsO family protein